MMIIHYRIIRFRVRIVCHNLSNNNNTNNKYNSNNNNSNLKKINYYALVLKNN